MQHNCTLFNWVPWNAVPKQLEQMRSLSVIIAMLVSTTISAQAYNCGMFGTITDDVNNLYIARFDLLLENVILESVISCEV